MKSTSALGAFVASALLCGPALAAVLTEPLEIKGNTYDYIIVGGA